MNKPNKTILTRIILICCAAVISLNLKSSNAQGNMLNPVEIMSPLVFSVQRLSNGNSLFTVCYSICDVEIIEVDKFGNKVWSFEDDLSWSHSAQLCEDTDTILISDTNNNRVIEINRKGEIVWSYDDDINYPNDADRLENGNTLITVRDSDKIIEVNPNGKVVWEYSGVKGPHNADRLANGNTIIANSMDNKIVEVDKDGNTVWTYAGKLFWPRDADRLANGNTLIADSRHMRALEVDNNGEIVWELKNLPSVFDVDRLENGNTLISVDLKPGQVIEVDKSGSIVWRWVASDLGKVNGFQYHPSEKTSYLRERIKQLVQIAENLNVPKPDFDKINQLLKLSRKALTDRQYELNKKLVYDTVVKLEQIIAKLLRCEQGVIEGKVIDSTTQKPVAHAKVFVFGTIYLTETNESGKFRLTNIPRLNAGYNLIIRKDDYFEKQIDQVFPTLPNFEQEEKTYEIDLFSDETKYRNEVLTLNFAILREQLKLDDFEVGSRVFNIPDKYSDELKPYLATKQTEKNASEFIKNLAEKVRDNFKTAKTQQAELIVLSALQAIYNSHIMNSPDLKLFDDVVRTDWRRLNGCFGQNYASSLDETTDQTKGFHDSHDLINTNILLLKLLNIPARFAWVKSHPVLQWWAQLNDSEGRWISTDILTMFEGRNPDSWMSSTLSNVPAHEITYIPASSDYPLYISWDFEAGGLWVENTGNHAYFNHNETGLSEAQNSIKSFTKRGFPAAKIENLIIAENVPIFSRMNENYQVFEMGVNLSLANMKTNMPKKFTIPVPANSEFMKILEMKIFSNHPDWIKSIDTETVLSTENGLTSKIMIVTIIPK